VELLVSTTIIAILLSVFLPAVRSVRGEVRNLVCANHTKSIARDFLLFADGVTTTGRGDSEKLGPGRFRIDDFQEMLYGIDEFWDLPEQTTGRLTVKNCVMMCPAGASALEKRRGASCGTDAIGSAKDVSLAFNLRLRRGSVRLPSRVALAPVASTYVRGTIQDHPSVPLIIDVDGAEAVRRRIDPFYIAPPIEDRSDALQDGRYWMPSARHRGKVNVGFVGGHVLASARPEWESWDWGYEADVGP